MKNILNFADTVAALLSEADIKYEREFRFHPARQWRFDFLIPDVAVVIECDGIKDDRAKTIKTKTGRNVAISGAGRHQKVKGYSDDAEKLNAAQIAGYRVFRVTNISEWGVLRQKNGVKYNDRVQLQSYYMIAMPPIIEFIKKQQTKLRADHDALSNVPF